MISVVGEEWCLLDRCVLVIVERELSEGVTAPLDKRSKRLKKGKVTWNVPP